MRELLQRIIFTLPLISVRTQRKKKARDFYTKWWYMIAQRAPTMNTAEQLMCSAYGRPQVRLITGKDVPREMQTDIYDSLAIEKGVIEAAVEDLKYDL